MSDSIFEEMKIRNSEDFNVMKALEEANEFCTAIIERYTKGTGLDNVIEEIGDLEFRLDMIKKLWDIEAQVEERYNHKKGLMERKAMLGKLGRSTKEGLNLQ